MPAIAGRPTPRNRPAAQCFWRTLASTAPTGSACSAIRNAIPRFSSLRRPFPAHDYPVAANRTPHRDCGGTASLPAGGRTAAETALRCGRAPQSSPSSKHLFSGFWITPPRATSPAAYPRAPLAGKYAFQQRQSPPPSAGWRRRESAAASLFYTPANRWRGYAKATRNDALGNALSVPGQAA